MSKIGKAIETESRLWVPGAGGLGANATLLLKGIWFLCG